MGLIEDATGALDHAAASFDESIGRQFDDEQGGGFGDETMSLLDPTDRASEQTEQDVGTLFEYGPAGAVAPGAQLLTIGTDIDESIGRQFDTEEGGGAADVASSAAS